MLAQLRGKIILSALLGLGVVVVLGLASDIGQVGQSFGSFSWATLPAILGFTALNYLLRWLKWDFYLRRMGMGQGVSYGDSALLFTSGMVMAVTPGKVGEVLKSYLLKRLNGTPISASAPIVLAERVTDGLAMLLLMGFGLTLYAPARPLFYLLLALTVVGLLIAQSRALVDRVLALVRKLPLGARVAPRLLTAYLSMRELLSWRILLISTLISLVSWFGECVAMYYVLRGLGVPASFLLLQQATFVFAASTLFGLVSFLPGGLGVSEGSSTLMLERLIPLPAGPATTATIIIRFCTLWFGVTLGAVALALFSRRYGDEREPAADPAAGEPIAR
ncbi:MAG TPA: lysylphosphatidylglycerol synthase transmembrane domain-containing protein [Kouleothrix sp.]|uniref:lysylphosphatidylglycerol synthase transmembrane domain-containing protein n=1 Tax=Kouleothrix sp. TaxID=2779161 RepID=UPI002C37F75A|nr:lysylphosphatidylglycerol synthase transmembrane domain-containing protein [Kouleothrix sp.]